MIRITISDLYPMVDTSNVLLFFLKKKMMFYPFSLNNDYCAERRKLRFSHNVLLLQCLEIKKCDSSQNSKIVTDFHCDL